MADEGIAGAEVLGSFDKENNALKSVAKEDAICEPGILSDIKDVAAEDVERVLKSLIDSYTGYGALALHLRDCLSLLFCKSGKSSTERVALEKSNETANEMLFGAAAEVFKENFVPQQVDKRFKDAKNTVWAEKMVSSARWRRVILELAEKYPGCNFLTYMLSKIAIKGWAKEVISAAASASSSFPLFEQLLHTVIGEMMKLRDDNALNQKVFRLENKMEFAHLCSRHEAAFFFALALLRNVESALKELSAMEQQSFAEKLGVKRCQWVLRRLWSDLREAGSAMGAKPMTVENLIFNPSTLSLKLSFALESMLSAKIPTVADVKGTEQMLMSLEGSLSGEIVHVVQQPKLFEFFLEYAFDPQRQAREDCIPGVLFVLVFSSIARTDSDAKEVIHESKEKAQLLRSLWETLQRDSSAVDQKKARATAERVLPLCPISSACVAFWVRRMFQRQSTYDLLESVVEGFFHMLEMAVLNHPPTSMLAVAAFDDIFYNFPSPSSEDSIQKATVIRLLLRSCVRLSHIDAAVIPVLRSIAKALNSLELDGPSGGAFVCLHLHRVRPPFSSVYLSELAAVLQCPALYEQWSQNLRKTVRTFVYDGLLATADERCDDLIRDLASRYNFAVPSPKREPKAEPRAESELIAETKAKSESAATIETIETPSASMEATTTIKEETCVKEQPQTRERKERREEEETASLKLGKRETPEKEVSSKPKLIVSLKRPKTNPS